MTVYHFNCVVDPTLVLTGVSTVAVLVGVAIGVRELRHFSKVREAEVLRTISSRSSSREFLEGFFLLSRMNYKTFDEVEGRPEEMALFQWLDSLEEMGILVKRGVVPIDVVDDFWHGAVRLIWRKTEPIVKSYRDKYKHPEFAEWAEYLYLSIYGSGRQDAARIKELEQKVYSSRVR